MNARPSRAEIWQVDMGIAGKVRPCLLLTDYPANDEFALVTAIPKLFLKEGAFHIQQVQSISLPKLMRRLGSLTNEEWNLIAAKLVERLGLVI